VKVSLLQEYNHKETIKQMKIGISITSILLLLSVMAFFIQGGFNLLSFYGVIFMPVILSIAVYVLVRDSRDLKKLSIMNGVEG